MAFPLISPYQQFFDSSGSPLAGGTIEFRDPTTNNLINSYPTADDADAQTNANDNPQSLDANGASESGGLYLEDGVKYKIILKSALGATVKTDDDVRCPVYSQASIAAQLIPQTADELAAGITPTNYYYNPGDIRRLGAIPDDAGEGSTNSTALNNAVLAYRNTGTTIRIEGGDYYISAQISVTAGANNSCRVNFSQDKNAKLISTVTGSISGFDTAGFAILFDGWKESQWNGFSLDYTSGTAGAAMRCRNQSTVFNDIISPMVRGGTVVGDRTTRTNVSWRFIGNESVASSTGYVCYWNLINGGYFDIAAKHMECVVGDGDAATQQPNAQKILGTQFERYLVAFDSDDTDEHYISGAWASNATTISVGTASSVTQSGGTATFNLVSHGLVTDDIVQISGATPTDYNGMTRITRIDDDSFTYTKTNGVAIPSGTTSPATGTITCTQFSTFFQGDSTLSQVGVNNESGGIGYYIEDGGSGGNIINIIDNIGSGNSVVEDLTEKNVIIDRQFYSASGTNTTRIGTTNLIETTATESTFNVPIKASSVRLDQVAVASATNITYTDSADVWRITGTTTTNTITDPGDGSPEITLIFNASVTVNDASTSSGNMKLAGGADLSATADDVLTLIWDKTNDQWLEKSRSVN